MYVTCICSYLYSKVYTVQFQVRWPQKVQEKISSRPSISFLGRVSLNVQYDLRSHSPAGHYPSLIASELHVHLVHIAHSQGGAEAAAPTMKAASVSV